MIWYYDPSLSLWLGVDPLADQFSSHSPYNYTFNNPINMIDPDGRAAVGVTGNPPGYGHQEVKRRIQNVAQGVVDGISSFGTSVKEGFMSIFSSGSNTASVTETLTDKKADTPNFSGKGIVNKAAKVLGPVMTAASIDERYSNMDPNDSASVQVFNEGATADILGLLPFLGPCISSILENSSDPNGTFNLDNNKMSDGYSSGRDAANNMTNARVRQRQMDAEKREANYTPEQERKMELRSSDNGYQKALRGG